MNYICGHQDIVVSTPFDVVIFKIKDKAVNKGEAVARQPVVVWVPMHILQILKYEEYNRIS